MEYATLNNGIKMPMAGIGTFLLTPDEAENSVAHALKDGYRLMEKAYKEGKVKAIGLSNFNKEQIQEILDICEVKPAVLQTEVHPYDQEKELKEFLAKADIVIQAWYPLGHGDAALLQEPVFAKLGEKYKKSPAQIILRWNVQQGVIVIPKSVHKERMRENLNIWDFKLEEADMMRIAQLDKDCPSMLDTRKISEVKRVYDYLNNPVLTSL